MPHLQPYAPLDDRFVFWMPGREQVQIQGVDSRDLTVPNIPLPLLGPADSDTPPSKEALGEGIYAYLRQFPECPLNKEYATLLQTGFPHYISDLAAQAVLIEHKTVDSPYLRRQINGLKILALLEPEKSELHLQLGIAYYRLALMFQELGECRRSLLSALGFLNTAVRGMPEDAGALNYLAHVNYLIGDYPVALTRWQQAGEFAVAPDQREAISERIRKVQEWDVPDYPLVDDLEEISHALEQYQENHFDVCLDILDGVAGREFLLSEFSLPEFFYLKGLCRLNLQQKETARGEFQHALELDADYSPAVAMLVKLDREESS